MPNTKLTTSEREYIFKSLSQKKSQNQIARDLSRSKSTISYEIRKRGFNKNTYSPSQASLIAKDRSSSRKLGQRKITDELAVLIRHKIIAQEWSPEQIAGRLKVKHPNNPLYHISHESIYQWIYSREATERELLIKFLRRKKKKRTSRKKKGEKRGDIQNPVSIHKKPLEHTDRSFFGNWEGDFIMGKAHQTAMGTFVDRKSRFVILVPLGNKKTAVHFADRLMSLFNSLPPNLKTSITYDRGSEMACHEYITRKTDIPIYFADPGSPWQRGSNENTNGLLRKYFPKGTPLNGCTYDEVQKVQDILNQRPQKILGYRIPEEVLNFKGITIG